MNKGNHRHWHGPSSRTFESINVHHRWTLTHHKTRERDRSSQRIIYNITHADLIYYSSRSWARGGRERAESDSDNDWKNHHAEASRARRHRFREKWYRAAILWFFEFSNWTPFAPKSGSELSACFLRATCATGAINASLFLLYLNFVLIFSSDV